MERERERQRDRDREVCYLSSFDWSLIFCYADSQLARQQCCRGETSGRASGSPAQ